jgi:hypothetical protein
VERCHGTQRHFNARKARKVYTFSKGKRSQVMRLRINELISSRTSSV